MKYTGTAITFREVPDEVTLCIEISGCPNHCEGCHSSHLMQDIGEILDESSLYKILGGNDGMTCVVFMGGDKEPHRVDELAKLVHDRGLKTAWYSGKKMISPHINLQNFDYIKIGPYIKDLGPLTSQTTNQRLYKVLSDSSLLDITHKIQNKQI